MAPPIAIKALPFVEGGGSGRGTYLTGSLLSGASIVAVSDESIVEFIGWLESRIYAVPSRLLI
jgi:hypothetical protein